MTDSPSVHADRASQPTARNSWARAGVALFVGAILLAMATFAILPALENVRYSEISRPDVVNQRGEPILVYSIDAAGGEVHYARIEPGASQRMFLARGMLSDEFVTRTIHVVVVGVRGEEIGRATLTGEVAEELGYVVVGQTLEFRGFDNKVIDVSEASSQQRVSAKGRTGGGRPDVRCFENMRTPVRAGGPVHGWPCYRISPSLSTTCLQHVRHAAPSAFNHARGVEQ